MNEFVNQVGIFLDGRHYVLDGVSGRIRYEVTMARYPSQRVIQKIWHEPDAGGRRTEGYRLIKQQLRDDHVTDLTDSERLCDIALELGFQPGAGKRGDGPSPKRVARARGHVSSDYRSVGPGPLLAALLSSMKRDCERARRSKDHTRAAALSADIEQLQQVRLCS